MSESGGRCRSDDDSGSIGYPAASTSGKLSSGDPWAVR